MTTAVPSIRLALDQNFPVPLITAVRDFLPADMHIAHLKDIDRRTSDLNDRQLILALHQTGWDGLIINNYKMLDVPEEVAAIVKTKLTVIAIEGLGHDLLRAVGALLLELPGIPNRMRSRRANVFRLTYRQRQPIDALEYFKLVAERRDRDLWTEVGVTDQELHTQVLR